MDVRIVSIRRQLCKIHACRAPRCRDARRIMQRNRVFRPGNPHGRACVQVQSELPVHLQKPLLSHLAPTRRDLSRRLRPAPASSAVSGPRFGGTGYLRDSPKRSSHGLFPALTWLGYTHLSRLAAWNTLPASPESTAQADKWLPAIGWQNNGNEGSEESAALWRVLPES